jgi:hypothetical protein
VAVAALRGGYPPEPGPDGSTFVWLGVRPRLAVVAQAPGPVQVTFDAVSHSETRTIRLASQRFVIAEAPTTVRVCIPVGSDGTANAPIQTTPSASRFPGGDRRIASVGVYRLSARPRCTSADG